MTDPLNKPAVNETAVPVQDAAQFASATGAAATAGSASLCSPESRPESGPDSRSDSRSESLEQDLASLKDQLLRALAEIENSRRRAQREREDMAKYAISNFAKDLLPVADNLRRALDTISTDSGEPAELLKALVIGVEATERQLVAAFERVAIKKLEPLGTLFDPNFHQVMFEVENAGRPAGSVVQVLQPGYTIHGRLLREAMVGVAKRGADETVHPRIDTKA
ncbi:MAG: nucleotide exchange factor GrpE [Rhodospirillaceae bacterium]